MARKINLQLEDDVVMIAMMEKTKELIPSSRDCIQRRISSRRMKHDIQGLDNLLNIRRGGKQFCL